MLIFSTPFISFWFIIAQPHPFLFDEREHQVSPELELTLYSLTPYCDGLLIMDADINSSFHYPAYFSKSRHPLKTDRQSFQEVGVHWLHLWAFWNKWRRSCWQAFAGAIFSCSILLLRTSSWSWGWWLFRCFIKLVVLKECRLTPPRITSALRALQIAALTCWSLLLPLIIKTQHRHTCTVSTPSFQPGRMAAFTTSRCGGILLEPVTALVHP